MERLRKKVNLRSENKIEESSLSSSESETEVKPTFFHVCATAQHYYRNEYVFTFFIGHCLAKENISKIFFRGSSGKGEVQKQIGTVTVINQYLRYLRR